MSASGDKSKFSITRRAVECPLFGAPSKLNDVVLPTIADIINYYLYTRQELKHSRNGKDPPKSEVIKITREKIEEIWKKASIPVVSQRRIDQMLDNIFSEYQKLIRFPKSKRNDNYVKNVQFFKSEAVSKLLDISACKCKTISKCACEKSKKVPPKEQEFLLDQRSTRKMVIGTLDKAETSKLRQREDRKTRNSMRAEKASLKSADKQDSTVFMHCDSSDEERNGSTSTGCEELIFVSQASTSKEESQRQMRTHLPTVSRVSDQYGVSDRCVAAIASAILQDVGIVTESDSSHIIDRSKVRRERKKTRECAKKDDLKALEDGIESIYFDGRKDKTLHQEKIGDRLHRRTISEEHVSLIEEPNSQYLGHITPPSGSGKHIAESILKYCTENNLNLDKLMAIGCDGTAVNTGRKNGAIRFIETKVSRPLQWLICQLHANELPLRHLFSELDGQTTGPQAYSGPIGKSLDKCEQLPVVEFKRIFSCLPEMNSEELSTDQNYFYDICQAVSSGQCSLNLANRNPGKISHSRWLTTANRLLRLYIGSQNPSQNLKIMAEFVMKVYAPMWFHIKKNSSCKSGAQNVFKTIQLSRYLREDLKKIVDPVIQRNAYFCHPENILLGMITDERNHVRELGFRRILKAREKACSTIREFHIPILNFSATDYIDIIDWQESEITSPPILNSVSTEELKVLTKRSEVPSFQFPKFPCHIQAVERCVKLVTEASLAVVGVEARDGYIRTKIKSRKIMPSFDTKAQYKLE